MNAVARMNRMRIKQRMNAMNAVARMNRMRIKHTSA